jgi:hypothetical protein
MVPLVELRTDGRDTCLLRGLAGKQARVAPWRVQLTPSAGPALSRTVADSGWLQTV